MRVNRLFSEGAVLRPAVLATAAIAALVLALLGGGAANTAPTRAPVPEPSPPPEPVEELEPAYTGPPADELHRRLDDIKLRYRASLELVLAGDEVEGKAYFADASNSLRETAALCAETPDCELTRFTTALDELLNEHTIALKQQASEIGALQTTLQDVLVEAREAEREPGTTAQTAVAASTESIALLRGNDLRHIIELSGPVNAAIDDWLTWMRPLLMSSYENYQYLRADMAPVYEEAGLPEALLFAIMASETGGKVHAVSRSGAAGPLQFMRRTGSRFGLGTEDGFDMRFDPAAATRANVSYLNERFETMNDDLEKALAAYNGGEYRVERLHRRLKGASFWDSKFYYSLPRETREYVPRVLAAAWLYLHPEDYSLRFPEVDPTRTTLTLRRDASLSELSVCLGQEQNPLGWFRTLRNLNPRVEPKDVLEEGSAITVPAVLAPIYEERCLEGKIVERARVLHEANYPEEPEIIPYVVRRGDTLGKIAGRHSCVSLQELAAMNNIRAPRFVIRVGQTIKIPGCS